METQTKPTIEQAGRALYDAHAALSDLSIPFILDGGTLLGFHRDGRFCDDDHDDIDLTVHAIFWHQADDIAERMHDKGFDLYHMWPRDVERCRSGQFAWKRDGVKIDLMFKELKTESKMAWWTVYGGSAGVTYKAVPSELLMACETLNIKVPIGGGSIATLGVGRPQKIDEYLEYRYGDWRTPVHRADYRCYTSDRAIVEPNTYEAI